MPNTIAKVNKNLFNSFMIICFSNNRKTVNQNQILEHKKRPINRSQQTFLNIIA